MTKRTFLSGLGAFFILPSAGRIWKAIAPEPELTMVAYRDQWGGRRFVPVFRESAYAPTKVTFKGNLWTPTNA